MSIAFTEEARSLADTARKEKGRRKRHSMNIFLREGRRKGRNMGLPFKIPGLRFQSLN